MHKLLQRLSFATFLPFVISSQVMAAQALASLESSAHAEESPTEANGTVAGQRCQLNLQKLADARWVEQAHPNPENAGETLAASAASSSKSLPAKRSEKDSGGKDPGEKDPANGSNVRSAEVQTLAARFAPPSPAALRAAACPEKLDIVSRELLLAALARVEQVEDAETQFSMLMGLAEVYQTLELPQTLPLLDYLFEQVQTMEEAGTRLSSSVRLVQRYATFRSDEKIPLPQEKAVIEAAVRQIVELNLEEAADLESEQGADIFAIARWYSQQNDLEKARQIVSHISEPYALDLFKQQLEESYAYDLEAAGEQAKADRHRRENLPPESLLIYAEAKAHERIAALAETLPETGEMIEPETLKALQRNVNRLEVPWAKYTYGQMVARQLMIQGQYEAALETLAQAPVPESEGDELYYYDYGDVEAYGEAEQGEAVDPATVEIDLGFDAARLVPAILATEVAADGYIDEALAFIDHLPETDSTRLFQRAILLSGIAVFQDGDAGDAAVAEAYLEEAIALAQDLPEQPANASLWFLISLAQRWHSDNGAAEQSMDRAIAIAPALESINDEILVELEKDPWIIDEEVIAASEEYGSIRDFYEALQEEDLEAAEAALAETEDLHSMVSMKGTLAAAYSKAEQSDRGVELLVELLELRTSEELLENFEEEAYLLQHLVSAFTSSNGYVAVLEDALAGLDELDAEQQERLWQDALESYSYSQGYEETAVHELLERRDLTLSLLAEDAPLREQMLRSLAETLANQGHWAEAISLIPEFSLQEQAVGLIALTNLYGSQGEQPEELVLQQLQTQIQTLIVPEEEIVEEGIAEEELAEEAAAEVAVSETTEPEGKQDFD